MSLNAPLEPALRGSCSSHNESSREALLLAKKFMPLLKVKVSFMAHKGSIWVPAFSFQICK